jgi:hypothetical protein
MTPAILAAPGDVRLPLQSQRVRIQSFPDAAGLQRGALARSLHLIEAH